VGPCTSETLGATSWDGGLSFRQHAGWLSMHLALSDIVKVQGAVAGGSAPLSQFAPFHAWLQLSLWLVCHISCDTSPREESDCALGASPRAQVRQHRPDRAPTLSFRNVDLNGLHERSVNWAHDIFENNTTMNLSHESRGTQASQCFRFFLVTRSFG